MATEQQAISATGQVTTGIVTATNQDIRHSAALIACVVAGICAVVGVGVLIQDWASCNAHPEWSASFSTYVALRLVEFFLPALALLAIGVALRVSTQPEQV